VEDLHKEWSQHESKKNEKHNLVEESSAVSKQENSKNEQTIFTSVLEPVLCPVDSNEATSQQGSKIKSSVSSH